MNLALMHAYKSLGNTKENPAVGCVIVNKDCVISAGNTSINGRPHAEHNAIFSSKQNVKNGCKNNNPGPRRSQHRQIRRKPLSADM